MTSNVSFYFNESFQQSGKMKAKTPLKVSITTSLSKVHIAKINSPRPTAELPLTQVHRRAPQIKKKTICRKRRRTIYSISVLLFRQK